MNHIISITGLLLAACCYHDAIFTANYDLQSERTVKRPNAKDNLFQLNVVKTDKHFVSIIAPKKAGFELPDSTVAARLEKSGDFNADGKEDMLVYLGTCGTGGCMYGLFLNQYGNYYKVAYLDYLKNAQFKVESNGLWTIESSEELEPYNPSKIQITIFKFDKSTDKYEIDTTYVYQDKEMETIIKNSK